MGGGECSALLTHSDRRAGMHQGITPWGAELKFGKIPSVFLHRALVSRQTHAAFVEARSSRLICARVNLASSENKITECQGQIHGLRGRPHWEEEFLCGWGESKALASKARGSH